MNFGLKDIDIAAINSVFSQYEGIDKVFIYSSRAKGNYKPGSDIDLSIAGDPTFSEQMRIEGQIDDLLLPYKVYLSRIHQISNPDLLEQIRRAGKIFYEKIKEERLYPH